MATIFVATGAIQTRKTEEWEKLHVYKKKITCSGNAKMTYVYIAIVIGPIQMENTALQRRRDKDLKIMRSENVKGTLVYIFTINRSIRMGKTEDCLMDVIYKRKSSVVMPKVPKSISSLIIDWLIFQNAILYYYYIIIIPIMFNEK